MTTYELTVRKPSGKEEIYFVKPGETVTISDSMSLDYGFLQVFGRKKFKRVFKYEIKKVR